MNQNSLKAYYSHSKYKGSIKQLIKDIFEETSESYTVKELINILNVKDRSLQPRISDLLNEGFLYHSKDVIEEGRTVGKYSIDKNQLFFPKKKVSKFDLLKMAINHTVHEDIESTILKEFRRLKKDLSEE